MHLPVGTLLGGGKYKIEKVLGQGGFGITYLAEQTSLGRKVALKEFFMEGLCNRDAATSHVSVPSVGSKKLVERFKQKFIKEARMIASFNNSHIISIHDVFEENGTAYYVMEYLGGKSLSAIVNEQGIMSETLALKYIRQVADALAEVHANNLLHLDVKPANIMLNKKGEAVLIDFGISKHYDEAGNQTSSALIGTSEGYAPLEQYEAGALDSFTPATDIYALGATLFFLLTGTRPPKASEVMNYGLPELPSGVSASVRSTIETAMQPAIAKRPQSIAEFLCLVESGNVKGENGKLKDESDGETIIVSGNSSTPGSEKSHSANNEILRSAQNDNSANGRQNDKDGKMKAASKREGENLFTHTASESSFDEVKVERRNEKEHSAGVVISNESEKSQKNKPGKSLWLILLLLFIAVAGAWFLFGGTGNGDASKADTVKKDTPTPPQGDEQEQLAEKGDSILDANDHSDTSDGTKIEDDKEDGDRNISADQITDGNKVSESKTPTGSETDIKGSGSTVVPNNNEEVKNFEKNSIRYNVTDKAKKTVEVAKGKYTGSIVIPETVVHNDVYYSVTSIGVSAFERCKGLTSIKIPNSVTSIGGIAFYGCKGLTNVTIPNSVTSIGDYAFYGCEGLTSINIPNSVTSIGWGAFEGCKGLTSIIVDKNNPKYDSRDNCNAIIETKTNELIAGCKNTVVPSSVTSIGVGAFYECSGLTSIKIPNSVKSIGGSAFRGCDGLRSITIPNSVTSIGERAFWGCSGLTSVTIPNSVTSIGSGAFCVCDGLTSITIGNSVTSIGERAFSGCSGLTSITIPNSVTSIGSDAFSGCTGLTSITIPNGVTSIGESAFFGCKGLTSITIPNSVTSIGSGAFYGCKGLTSITIPNSVTSIDIQTFYDCSGLTSITIPNSVTSIGSLAFSGCVGLTSIIVDKNNPKYDSRDNCNAIIETRTNELIVGCKNTVIPGNVTSIGESAFSGCTGLTSIKIPNSVKSIGESAFFGCKGLTSITILNSVTSIGESAFSYCSGLENVIKPDGISIGRYAFEGTPWLKKQK